jgi:cytochrome c oxidase assembly factor CtaG
VLAAAWNPAPLPLVAGAVALALYAQGFVRLRRRSSAHAPLGHAALFAAGVAVSVLALVSPLDGVADDKLLSAHMLQHLLLGDVGPLLIVLGLRGALLFFLLPASVLAALAGVAPLRRLGSFLLQPRVAIAVWLLAVAGWHVPAAYDAAAAHPALHALEHACFALAGLLVWIQIVDPARQRRLTPGRRSALALLLLASGTILAEVLLVAAPLYPRYAELVTRPLGLTASEDQRRAALLMMAEQIATLGTAAALLLWANAAHASSASTGRRRPRRPGSAAG